MKNSEKQYKIDHRGYQNIGELCDDLRDLTPNIRVEGERIVLFAPLDTLVIKLSNRGGYYVYRNGVQQNDVWDDQDLYPYVLEIQQNAPALEWLEVKDQKSVNDLLRASVSFHDGSIVSVERIEDETRITFCVWDGYVHLKLKDAELSPLCQAGYGNLGEIYDSNLFFENDRIFWANWENARTKSDLSEDDCWFSASRLYRALELH